MFLLTNVSIYVYFHDLWTASSGQSSWLQIQRFRIQFPALQDLLEVVGLRRGLLNIVRIIEELLEKKQ
jgi:hypothetical protein